MPTKNTLSIADIVRLPWSPVRHPVTLRRHIDNGNLIAHVFKGRTPDGNRYEITKRAFVAFCRLFDVRPPKGF